MSCNIEPSAKKAANDDTDKLELLEKKVYSLIHCSLELIHTRFVAFRNKQSPKVSAVQSNMNIHSHTTNIVKEVENKGFLSCHLCLNAQTQEQHTEPDASYTIIAVPKKILSSNKNALNAYLPISWNISGEILKLIKK